MLVMTLKKNSSSFLLLFLLVLIPKILNSSENVDIPQPETLLDLSIPMANLEGEPSAFIHGHVNVITGDFNDFQVDLTIPGVEPLTIERSFSGSTENKGSLAAGWNLNLYGTLDSGYTDKHGKKYQIFVTEGHGATCLYEKILQKKEKSVVKLPIPLSNQVYRKGVTNTSAGVISGQTNIRNNKACKYCDKTYRVYNGSNGFKEYYLPTDGAEVYCLRRDVKPNGNLLRYRYLPRKNHEDGGRRHYRKYDQLRKVEIKSPDYRQMGTVTYTHLKFKEFKKTPYQDVIAGDGRKVRYHFKLLSKHNRSRESLLTKIERTDAPVELYEYTKGEKDAGMLVSRKLRPDGRYIGINYYKQGVNHIGSDIVKLSKRSRRCNRVKSLQAPVAEDSRPVDIYRFHYSFDRPLCLDSKGKSGSTTVLDALNNKSVYTYTKDHRLKNIDKFSGDGNIYSKESLYWGSDKSELCSYLLARTLASGSGALTFARTYSYDKAGNVLQDILYGNLSGRSEVSPIIGENGEVIENSCERYQKNYKYSDDGFNLLLWESDGIHETTYEYENGSNRLSAKFIGEPNKIHLREFYEYNIESALTKKIVDDGLTKDRNNLIGVSERHITEYIPRTCYPFGYPEVVIEKYLDLATGQEVLKNKTVNSHNNQGLLIKQIHYDNTDSYLFTLSWDYNDMGKLTREVDALQRVSEWYYDPNGNCFCEQGPDRNVHKSFIYDYANRLVRQEEVHSDGIRKGVSYRYNLLSQPVAIRDHNDNETQYHYDAFGRVTQVIYPPVIDETGALASPTLKKSYDLMGNLTTLVDSKGNEKHMSYTVRGQITKVQYPDGSCESKVYNKDGSLQSMCEKNGTIISYLYDVLGRVVKTEMTSSMGELLSVTSATYNAFHMLSKTDAMGHVTSYTYYSSGQLKSEQSGSLLVTYTYDACGRLKTTCEHYGPNPEDVIVRVKEYDLLNRITEERVEDYQGAILTKINNSYDVAGRIYEIRSGEENVTATTYNSHGVPVEVIDGEGNKTLTNVTFNHINSLGQKVNYKEITDPLNNITSITYDVLGRIVSTVQKNSKGEITQKQDTIYDLNNNRCLLIDTIFSGSSERKVITKWSFDNLNRQIACYEAFDTPEQKHTRTQYNHSGQKSACIKADGTILYYTYDALGRLSSFTSSDNSIHYAYTYDLNNHPIKVDDHVHNTSTIKEYDHNGKMIKEVLGHGMELEYEYDGIGRTNYILLPDKTGFAFTYKGHFLKMAKRVLSEGLIAYEHEYECYDLSGRLTLEKFIGNAGHASYSYDKNGQLKQAYSDHWEESLDYDQAGNLIEQRQKDFEGERTLRYRYDDLYQLVSEEGMANHTYQYDSLYNQTLKDDKIHSYNALNQLLNDSDASYTYDLNGNLLKKASANETLNFAYDALDRLIGFTNGHQEVHYWYDDTNRRLTKEVFLKGNGDGWVPELSIKYVYQGQNEIGSINSSGEIAELRLLGEGIGAEVGAAVALEIDKTVYVPIHDHAGHIICLIDPYSGKHIETYRYSAYGEELFDQGISPWRYSSKRVDEESGLVYFGRRYYNPACGRWISQDPIGLDGGPNLYAYLLNNPLTHCDFYGLSSEDCVQGGIGNLLSSLAMDALKLPGRIIECAAFHLIPVPGLKDIVGCLGWTLQGQNPYNFTPSWEMPQCQLYHHQGYGDTYPNHRYVMYNGICTFFDDFKASCAEYSRECGGVDVYGVYNATNGFVGDILEVCCQKLDIFTNAQFCAERDTRAILNSMGEHKHDATLYAKAHSQGCETVYNLSRDVRMTMDVKAYGPARVLQQCDFKDAHNFLSPCDFVTYIADGVGLMRGINEGNVSFVRTLGCPLFCHFIAGPTYSGLANKLGYKHIRKYGSVR